jgi:starch synthase
VRRYSTVSPTYAREIAGHGAINAHCDKMVGIRNGIDVELWDPATDVLLTQAGKGESGSWSLTPPHRLNVPI